MAAPDPVGCWGSVTLMRDLFNLPVTVITGPATDNEVGRDYVKAELQIPAHNALRDAEGLVGVVRDALEARAQATNDSHQTSESSLQSAVVSRQMVHN